MLSFEFLRGPNPVFFIGTSKNSGKTTTMNAMLRIFREICPGISPGIVSTGIDGEKVDAIYGFEKPPVPVETGDIICTSGAALEASTANYTILDSLNIGKGPEQMLFVQVMTPGTILLVGPGNNLQLAHVISALARHGAGQIFVDGAIDRSTQIGIGRKVSVVLCAAPRSNETETSFAERIAERAKNYDIPPWKETEEPFSAEPGDVILISKGETPISYKSYQLTDMKYLNTVPEENIKSIQVGGAFTEQLWKALPKNKTTVIVVTDPSRIFVPFKIFSQLRKEGRIFNVQQTKLELITVRSTGIKGSSLDPVKTLEAMQKKLEPVPVIDLLHTSPPMIKEGTE